MIVTCPKCSAQFQFDDDLVKSTGTKVRCARCSEIFTVQPESKWDDSEFDFLFKDPPASSQAGTSKKNSEENTEFFLLNEELLDKELAAMALEQELSEKARNIDSYDVELALDEKNETDWNSFEPDKLPIKENPVNEEPTPMTPKEKTSETRQNPGFHDTVSLFDEKKEMPQPDPEPENLSTQNPSAVQPQTARKPSFFSGVDFSSETLASPSEKDDILPTNPKSAIGSIPVSPSRRRSSGKSGKMVAPPKKKRGIGKLFGSLFLLFLFLILLFLAYCCLSYAQKNKLISLPFELVMPFQIEKLPLLNYFFPTQKIEEAALDDGNLYIRTSDIEMKYVVSKRLGKLFVLTGKVKNTYPEERSEIRLRARLFVGSDIVRARTVYAGNIISEENLLHQSITEIEAELNKPEGDLGSNENVASQAELPFMFVFADPPENLSGHAINVIGSLKAAP